MKNRLQKSLFSIWLALCAVLCLFLILRLFSGFHIDTNVLNLLPKTQSHAATEKAIGQFSKRLGNQVVFLISNPEQKQAQLAADAFDQQLQKSQLFENIHYKINQNEQSAWAKLYFPHRLGLLTQQDQSLLQQNQVQQISSKALSTLYSPLGISNADLLKTDPYFLFQRYLLSRPKPSNQLSLYNNRLMTQQNHRWYVMITAQLHQDSFSISNQKHVLTFIKSAKQKTLSAVNNTNIIDTGMIFYAQAGTHQAQRDISTIGVGSIIGIVLLIIWVFRSLSPLAFTLFSAAMGFLAAFLITDYCFGSINLFTLVFGASLIGICVDYAFFYLSDRLLGDDAWTPKKGIRHILPGTSLGLLNIVLAYGVLSLTPFPGLKQLALFATTGLCMAFFTVIATAPFLLKKKAKKPASTLLKVCNAYLSRCQNLSKRSVTLIYLALLLFSFVGIMRLHPNDNIKILQPVSAQLKQNERAVRSLIGDNFNMDFILVSGSTAQAVLMHAEKLSNQLQQAFPAIPHPSLNISQYLPSIATQKQNYQLLTEKLLGPPLTQYLNKVGMQPKQIQATQEALANTPFTPLTLTDWLQSPASNALRYLWLGKQADSNTYFTVILLTKGVPLTAVSSLVQQSQHAVLVNQAQAISHVFQQYRIKITLLLLAAYLVLLLLLIVRYSFKNALLYFLPPCSAALIGTAILGWLHIPLTLFSLLGLILVLGIAVDYVLFFAETRSSNQSTMLAVTLSAITTILSFGLLALSSTPAVHFFGTTVFAGIAMAYLLCPLTSKIKSRKNKP